MAMVMVTIVMVIDGGADGNGDGDAGIACGFAVSTIVSFAGRLALSSLYDFSPLCLSSPAGSSVRSEVWTH